MEIDKKYLTTAVVVAILGLLLIHYVSIIYENYDKHKNSRIVADQENQELKQQLLNSHYEMRTMAYHQAVAELEREYPLEMRNAFSSDMWEDMLNDRTDRIWADSVISSLPE